MDQLVNSATPSRKFPKWDVEPSPLGTGLKKKGLPFESEGTTRALWGQ